LFATFHRRVSIIIAFFRIAVTGPKILMLRLQIDNLAKSGPNFQLPSDAEMPYRWNDAVISLLSGETRTTMGEGNLFSIIEPTVFPRAYFKHHRLP
jgi:hypothetical protein